METPLGAMSFEQILAQADANMKKDKGEANPAPKSFADMVEEAQRQLAESMETKEEPAKEPEVKQEEPAASAVPTGLSFEDLFNQAQERTDAEPQNAVAEAEAKAKAEAEAKEAEAKAKAEAEAKAKAKEAAEPLPDTTDSYRVEIPGKTDIPAKEEVAQETGSVMEALFTKEEIEAFRKDIRTLVRAEFKAAMVGAVKDLLSDFNG